MMSFITRILDVLYVGSLVCGVPCVAYTILCELIGYDKGNDLLKTMHFPLDQDELILIGYICAAICILSIYLKNFLIKKFFK